MWYPGQVFGDEELSYEEAMKQFVTDSQAEIGRAEAQLSPEAAERAQKKAENKELRQKERKLTVERLQVRQNREQEDAEWKKVVLQGFP